MEIALGNVLVTVVVPVRNEEKNLAACVASARSLGPVVVVDSTSSDRTCVLAAQLGAEVLQFRWDGGVVKKRNWMLRTFPFQTPWVLFLDADERLSGEFIAEAARTLPHTRHDGFWVRYDDHFMGRRLRFGDPMQKLSLVRVGRGEFEVLPDGLRSDFDMEIHEHLIVRGSVGQFRARIAHHNFNGISHWFAKHNEYSSWEAQRYLALRDGHSNLTWRQRVKYALLGRYVLPVAYFIGAYIFRLGFLDGAAGLQLALAKLCYFIQIDLKVSELKARRNQAEGVP